MIRTKLFNILWMNSTRQCMPYVMLYAVIQLLSFRSLLIEAMKLNDQLKDVICNQSNKTTLSDISCDQSEGGIRLSDNSGRNPDNSEGGNPIENDPSSILSIQVILSCVNPISWSLASQMNGMFIDIFQNLKNVLMVFMC